MATLYLKYRSQKLDELDLKDVRKSLKQIVKSTSIPHAFLFSGPKGTGKTSAARILAKVINCENRRKNSVEPCNKCDQCTSITKGGNIDIIELDAASHRGIDDVRALRDAVKLSPAKAPKKVYIIDEAHMLTTEASNALLKTLEEPPEHVIFILATTNPEKLIGTIRSRVTNIKFNKATTHEIVRALTRVAEGEKIKADKGVLEAIASASDGSFRDAIKLLEQLTVETKKLKIEDVEKQLLQGSASEIEKFISFLAEKNITGALGEIEKVVVSGGSIKIFLEQLITRLREALLVEVGIGENNIDGLGKTELIQLIELFFKATGDLSTSVLEQLPVEIAVVRWCEEGKQSSGVSSGSDNPVKEEVNNQEAKKTSRAAVGSSQNSRSPDEVLVKKNQESPKVTIEVIDQVVDTTDDNEPNEKLSAITDGVWKSILLAMRLKNASTEALLRAAKPVDFDGITLTLGVYYQFHKERLEEHQHRNTVETTIGQIVGSPVKIVCALTQPPAKPELQEVVKDPREEENSFDQEEMQDIAGDKDSSLTKNGDNDIVKIAKDLFS